MSLFILYLLKSISLRLSFLTSSICKLFISSKRNDLFDAPVTDILTKFFLRDENTPTIAYLDA